MEIPKFRRKPKNPTIATDPTSLAPRDADDMSPQPLSAASARPPVTTQKQGLRKNAFRGLHLRSAVKRARSPAPQSVALSTSSPSSVSTNDGGAQQLPAPAPMSPVSMRHRDGHLVGQKAPESVKQEARIPPFLEQSVDDINSKFSDFQWTDHTRAVKAITNPDPSNPYAQETLTNMSRGPMDRYGNIKPYKATRVRLNVPDSTPDYVNASAVSLCSRRDKLPPLRYIAMQGPTGNSVDFVWRMVAEQLGSPAVIVQLTVMEENGAEKCFPYLPLSEDDETWVLNEQDVWGDGWRAELRFDSLETLADGAIEVRKLVLKVDTPAGSADLGPDADGRSSEERTVTENVVWHFLYTRWPDFGAPSAEDLESFLTLMRLSRQYAMGDYDSTSGNATGGNVDRVAPTTITKPEGEQQREVPARIIHCSAGVGRTGTFISLEHLMRELDAGLLEEYAAADDGSSGSTTPSPNDNRTSGHSSRHQSRNRSKSQPQSRSQSRTRRAGARTPKQVGESMDPIAQTVKALREQRMMMVQALPQFHFLYQTLRQMWVDRHGASASAASEETDEVISDEGEPAAKRLEVGDPFMD